MIKIKKVMQLELEENFLKKCLKLVKIYDYVEKTDLAHLFKLCFIDKKLYRPKELSEHTHFSQSSIRRHIDSFIILINKVKEDSSI